MGKKGGVSCRKTLCNTNKNEKQLHSVIKVLKPKVYIIDSSNFKQLVQELTGFREQVVHREDNCYKIPDLQPASIETDSPFGSLDLFDVDQAFQTANQDMLTTYDLVSDQNMITSNLFAYQNLESWLLDVADSGDHHHHQHPCSSWFDNYNGSSGPNEQEDSLFDYYELSSLI